jgi:hypothetical protein
MAGLGKKTFVAGEVLLAQDVNGYLMDQSVMVFGGTAARSSAIPTPTEGMMSYRTDDDVVEVFDGSAYVGVGVGGGGQVVSTAKTDTFSASVATGANTAVTGLSVTITPTSATSKILVTYVVNASLDSNPGNQVGTILFRGATAIGIGDASGSRQRWTSGGGGALGTVASTNSSSGTFLDEPATTSAITYSINIATTSGATQTVYVNRSGTDTNNNSYNRSISTITVMEVK